MDYGQPVRFGVFLTPAATEPGRLLTLAALAEQLGFDVIGVQDHPYQRRFLDTWTPLRALAMPAEKGHVCPAVANRPLRPAGGPCQGGRLARPAQRRAARARPWRGRVLGGDQSYGRAGA